MANELRFKDGSLLFEGGSLAMSADCCCETCCSFTLCGSATPTIFLCGTPPVGLTAGDIVKIGDDCYEYNGESACAGGETTPTYGDVFDSCNQCIGIPDCSATWCSEEIPDAVFVTISGLAYDGAGLDCEECNARNTSYTVPFDGCVGGIMSFFLELAEGCTGVGVTRIAVNLTCNAPYSSIGIQVSVTEGSRGGFKTTHIITGTTSAIDGFSSPVVVSTYFSGECGASGTATISL